MKTTLSPDPDVGHRVRQELASGKNSFNEVINERLRPGFALQKAKQRPSFRVKPHFLDYRPGIDPAKSRQLVDERQVEEFIRKSQSR